MNTTNRISHPYPMPAVSVPGSWRRYFNSFFEAGYSQETAQYPSACPLCGQEFTVPGHVIRDGRSVLITEASLIWCKPGVPAVHCECALPVEEEHAVYLVDGCLYDDDEEDGAPLRCGLMALSSKTFRDPERFMTSSGHRLVVHRLVERTTEQAVFERFGRRPREQREAGLVWAGAMGPNLIQDARG